MHRYIIVVVSITVLLFTLGAGGKAQLTEESGKPMCFVMTLEVQTQPDRDFEELRDAVIRVLKNRFQLLKLSPVRIAKVESNRIAVAWHREPDLQLVTQVVTQIGLLEFRRIVAEFAPSAEFAPEPKEDEEILLSVECQGELQEACIHFIVKKEPLLTGAALAKAELRRMNNPYLTPYYIALILTDEGARQWREAILQLQPERDRLAIVIDRIVYSAPVIARSLFDAASRTDKINTSVITGKFTKEEAQLLTNILNSGVLPVEVKVLESGFAQSDLCPHSGGARFLALMGVVALFIVLVMIVLKR